MYEHASALVTGLLSSAHVIIIPSIAYHARFEAAFLLLADGMYGAFMVR